MVKKERQQWYIATLVIASKDEDSSEVQTREEQIRAIHVPNADAVYEKALQIISMSMSLFALTILPLKLAIR